MLVSIEEFYRHLDSWRCLLVCRKYTIGSTANCGISRSFVVGLGGVVAGVVGTIVQVCVTVRRVSSRDGRVFPRARAFPRGRGAVKGDKAGGAEGR